MFSAISNYLNEHVSGHFCDRNYLINALVLYFNRTSKTVTDKMIKPHTFTFLELSDLNTFVLKYGNEKIIDINCEHLMTNNSDAHIVNKVYVELYDGLMLYKHLLLIDTSQFIDMAYRNFELYKTSILFQCAYLYNFIAQCKKSEQSNIHNALYIDLLSEHNNSAIMELKQWIRNVIDNETNTYILSVYIKVLNFNIVKIVNKTTNKTTDIGSTNNAIKNLIAVDKIRLIIYCSLAIMISIIIFDIVIHFITGRCAFRKS